jgi:HPt (histidine-containing phosphotransfer) domain-containing protein
MLEPEPAAPAFDRHSLLERLMGDEELVADVVVAFLQEGPGQVEAIADAHARGDIAATQRLAHRVKGAAANLSALRLQQIASALETACREGRADRAALLVPRLQLEFDRAMSAMRAMA